MRSRRPWANQGRGADKRLRGRAGQRQRQRRLARTNGLCEHCLDEDLVTIATVVNHKIPLARGGDDVDENTENLCARHDAIATAKQFGRQAPDERGVDAGGRPTSPGHPWNRSSRRSAAGEGEGQRRGRRIGTPTPPVRTH